MHIMCNVMHGRWTWIVQVSCAIPTLGTAEVVQVSCAIPTLGTAEGYIVFDYPLPYKGTLNNHP